MITAVAVTVVWSPWGAGSGTAGKAATDLAARALPITAMDGLLLTRTEVGAIFGAGPVGPRKGHPDEIFPAMAPTRRVVDDECNLGTPALQRTHADSSWRAVRRQFLATQPADISDAQSLVQAVVNYPDASSAQRFLATSTEAWKQCANRTANLRTASNTSDSDDYWSTGSLSRVTNGIRMTFTQRSDGADDRGWSCEDSLTVHGNVVVELEICGQATIKPTDDVTQRLVENIVQRQ